MQVNTARTKVQHTTKRDVLWITKVVQYTTADLGKNFL